MKKTWIKTSLKNSVLSIMVGCSMFASALIFAENSLVSQAKELQTGSEKVGIDHQKAIELLKKASDEGDGEAKYLLSKYYSVSFVSPYLFESQRKEDQLLYEAAMKGHPLAMEDFYSNYNFDQIHYNTSTRHHDMPSFLAKVKEQAKTDPKTMLILAKILLEEDSRINQNHQVERCKLYEKAYQKAYMEAASGLLLCQQVLKLNEQEMLKLTQDEQKFTDQHDIELKALLNKAKSGNIQAAIALISYESQLYELVDNEKEIDQLKAQVSSFYEKQGKKGYADAYIDLAQNEVDSKVKQKWLLKAIDLDDADAMNTLALQWMFLENDPKLAQKAEKLLERSVALGSANGMNQLAVLKMHQYEQHPTQKKLLQEYTELFQRAAEKGQLQAMDVMAFIKSEPENYQWAVKAYENGSDEIDVLELAQLAFEKGLGVSKQLDKAKEIKQLVAIKKKIYNIQFPAN